jgi:hypothetical protein
VEAEVEVLNLVLVLDVSTPGPIPAFTLRELSKFEDRVSTRKLLTSIVSPEASERISISTREKQGNDRSAKLVLELRMSEPNRVWRSMSTSRYKDPTVHFFGWDQQRKDLTEDRGQPEGELHEMTLDSMTHAIVMNRGEVNPYKIKIGLHSNFEEYILILNLPRIIFVARYSASNFQLIIPENLRQEMNKLSGLMNAKVNEIDGKDGPHELGSREGSELVIYHPEVIVSPSEGKMLHYDMPKLKHTFKIGAVSLKTLPYPPTTCTLVIEQGNTGEFATHYVV